MLRLSPVRDPSHLKNKTLTGSSSPTLLAAFRQAVTEIDQQQLPEL